MTSTHGFPIETAARGASALGYLIFDTIPDALPWTRAAIIIASGLYILHRECVQQQRALAMEVAADA